MAASTNAVQVFWGTAWDDQTLLAREARTALPAAEKDGGKHRFITDAAAVSQEVPEYADFVREQVGHKELQTTLNCYTYSTTRREEQVEKLQKSLVL